MHPGATLYSVEYMYGSPLLNSKLLRIVLRTRDKIWYVSTPSWIFSAPTVNPSSHIPHHTFHVWAVSLLAHCDLFKRLLVPNIAMQLRLVLRHPLQVALIEVRGCALCWFLVVGCRGTVVGAVTGTAVGAGVRLRASIVSLITSFPLSEYTRG